MLHNARIDSVLCNLYPYKGWLPNETIQGEFYSRIPIDSCVKIGEKEDAGLRDAWWERGFGYGATFHDPLPYRIDHILYSKGIKLRSIKKVDANGLSDHDALVAEFEVTFEQAINLRSAIKDHLRSSMKD